MKNAPLLCLLVVVMAGAFAGQAEAVYKCTAAKGVVYQDRPCREGTETEVQIVVPTGELAPMSLPAPDEWTQGNSAAAESRSGERKQRRPGDESASATRSAGKRAATASAVDDSPKKDTRSTTDSSVPMSAEQARKTEATSKYYTTDASPSGTETPEHMTCESPTGEKRRFVLSNGKLTSI